MKEARKTEQQPPGPWSLQGLAPTDWIGGAFIWFILLTGSSGRLPGAPVAVFQAVLPLVAVVNTLEGLYVSWLAMKRGRVPALWLLLTLLLGYIALVRVRQLPAQGDKA